MKTAANMPAPVAPVRHHPGAWKPALAFAVFTAFISLTGYAVFMGYRESIANDSKNNLAGIAELKVGQLALWMGERKGDAEALKNDPMFLAAVDNWLRQGAPPGKAKSELLGRLAALQQANAKYGYDSISLFDSKGVLLLSSSTDEEPIQGPEKTGLLESMRSGQIVFSDLHREEVETRERIEIELRVPLAVHEHGAPHTLGAILFRIDPHRFIFPLIQHWPTPSASGENVLVRRDGDEAIVLNELRLVKNAPFAMRFSLSQQQLLATRAVTGQLGLSDGEDYRGVSVLGVSNQVPGTAWLLISKIDQSEVYAPLNHLAYWTIALMLALVGAGGAITAFWRQKEIRQHKHQLARQALTRHFVLLRKYANDIILLLDSAGNIVDFNDRAVEMLGYSTDQFLHLGIDDIRAPGASLSTAERLRGVEAAGGALIFESVLVRKDRTIFPVEASIRRLVISDEKFYQAIVRDITERKEAEETLRFHSEILKNLSEGIFLIRASDGMIVFTNPQFDLMFGYQAGELVGKHVSIVNAPGQKNPEAIAREINAELATSGSWVGKVRNIKKDGAAFWCQVHVSAFVHRQYGKVWVAMHKDITEHEEAEQVKLRLNRALRLLSEASAAMIHAVDEQRLLDSICRLVVETGGYMMAWVGFAEHDAEKTIRPVAQSGYEQDYLDDAKICWDENSARSRGPTGTAVLTGVTQVNQNSHTNPSMQPWRSAILKRGYQSNIALPLFSEGRILGALTIYAMEPDAFVASEVELLEELANNLAFGIETLRTRAKKSAAEQELEQHRRNLEFLVDERTAELAFAKREAERANNSKSRFLAAASHDLRQPLSALKLYTGVLKEKLSAGDQAILTDMEGCVSSLSALLSKLLDLSKLEAGVISPQVCDFSLDDMLGQVLAAYGPAAETRKLSLRCGCFGVTARTDPVLFQRIVGNFVDNAIHYTRHGGILIGLRRLQGKRWIEVWDTGIGIPEDKIAEIFEEFRQIGDEARTRGSGLGLTIAAKTASLLDLEIRVHSRPGRGSMFAIELPHGKAGHVAPRNPARARSILQGARIAIVDDNPFMLNALSAILRDAGYQVVAAAAGKEILARLNSHAPDVIVCDYRLGANETGFDVISQVRRTFGREDLPAVIITGDTDPGLIRDMAEKGIAIQHKPMEFDDLQARIEEAVTAHAHHERSEAQT